MEYARFDAIAARVERPADATVADAPDTVYGDMMAAESDVLRVVERVSEDRRSRDIRKGNAWHLPLVSLAGEYVRFVRDVYRLVVDGGTASALERLRSPDGTFYTGVTVVLLACIAMLL